MGTLSKAIMDAKEELERNDSRDLEDEAFRELSVDLGEDARSSDFDYLMQAIERVKPEVREAVAKELLVQEYDISVKGGELIGFDEIKGDLEREREDLGRIYQAIKVFDESYRGLKIDKVVKSFKPVLHAGVVDEKEGKIFLESVNSMKGTLGKTYLVSKLGYQNRGWDLIFKTLIGGVIPTWGLLSVLISQEVPNADVISVAPYLTWMTGVIGYVHIGAEKRRRRKLLKLAKKKDVFLRDAQVGAVYGERLAEELLNPRQVKPQRYEGLLGVIQRAQSDVQWYSERCRAVGEVYELRFPSRQEPSENL